MWHARDVRVHADGHDARRLRAVFPQAVQLQHASVVQLIAAVVLNGHQGDVIDFHGVGHGEHRPWLGLNPGGLIVNDPIGHILDACR